MSNCGIAKRHAGHENRRPDARARLASRRTPQISQNGTIEREHRAAAGRPSRSVDAGRVRVTVCSAMIGVPSAPNATGAVFAMSDRPDAVSGLKPSPMSSRARDRDRRAEPRGALEERAEAERDEQELQPRVRGHARDAVAEDRRTARASAVS